jgi:hypothetical protein
MPVEFGPLGPELSQGDLFDLVPSVYVHDLGYMSKTDTTKYRLLRNRPESFKLDAEHAATAMAIRRPAIVVTHDCEIDKPHSRATVLMALVRPIDKVPDEHRDGFRDYTRHRAFYLPETSYLTGENYADLRAITTIRRDMLDELRRLASMSEDGRRMLREQLFRFFSRRFLPDDWTTWSDDE